MNHSAHLPPAFHASVQAFDSRQVVRSLLASCPYGAALAACPLTAVRAMSPVDRFAWARGLSDDKCRRIHAQHCACAQSREGSCRVAVRPTV